MAETQIDKLRIRHESILNWLLANPDKTQGECAEVFGVTEPWLSVIVNSDVFQARLRERQGELATNMDGIIKAKMLGVVDRGLGRLEKMVETSPDPTFVLQTSDKLLQRLGYGSKAAAPQQAATPPVLQVHTTVLLAAQARMSERGQTLAADLVARVPREIEERAAFVLRDAELQRANGSGEPE